MSVGHAGELSNTAGRCSLVAVSEGRSAEGRGMATLDTRSKRTRAGAHSGVKRKRKAIRITKSSFFGFNKLSNCEPVVLG